MVRLGSTTSTLGAALVSTFVLFSAAAPKSFIDEDAPVIQKALSLKEELKALPGPDEEALEAVAELSEIEVAELEGATFYRFWNGGEAGVVCCLPMEEDLAAACVVALVPDRVVSATLIDAEGRAIPEWTYFFDQLQFKTLPTVDSAVPVSEYDLVCEEIAEGAYEEAELAGTLLRLVSLMQEQAKVFNLPRLRNNSPTAEDLEAFAEVYADVAGLKDDLQSLLGEAAPEFEALATSSSETYRSIASMVRAGQLEQAATLQRQITQNCRSCHGLENHNLEGPLSKAIEAKRDAMGIGDGFYRVGYDLRQRHDDPEVAQRAAFRMRQAVLLATTLPEG